MTGACEFCSFGASQYEEDEFRDPTRTMMLLEASMSNFLVVGLSNIAAADDLQLRQHEENISNLRHKLQTTLHKLKIAKDILTAREKINAEFEKRLDQEERMLLSQQQNKTEQRAKVVDLQQSVEKYSTRSTAVQYSLLFALTFLIIAQLWMFSANYTRFASSLVALTNKFVCFVPSFVRNVYKKFCFELSKKLFCT